MRESLPPGIGKDTLLREAGLSAAAARLVSADPGFIELLAQRPDEIERIRKELVQNSDAAAILRVRARARAPAIASRLAVGYLPQRDRNSGGGMYNE
jgi:hypothetical protein